MKEIPFENVDRIILAQVRKLLWALVKMMMNRRIL
jgi:hypothetical protein